MFLDLETTGLSGGAGTVAFLVGIGFFENGAFRTRQFLLPGFASERALLHAVAECLGEAGCLVTYNGKTFDLPVMETRWLLSPSAAGLDRPDASRHAPRVTPAVARAGRRSRRRAAGWCSWSAICLASSGWETSQAWRSRGAISTTSAMATPSQLEPVLHHNRLDLLSLALLTARAIRLIREACGRDAWPHRHQSPGASGGRARVAAAASAECRGGLLPGGRRVCDGA